MPPRQSRGGSSRNQPQSQPPAPAPAPASSAPATQPSGSGRGRGGGGGGGARGGRGGGRGRGGPSQGGRGGQPPGSTQQSAPSLAVDPVALPAASTTTVGVKRPANGYGTAGKKIEVFVNATEISIPSEKIYHYDVAITGPSGKTDSFPARFTQELMKQLQFDTAPGVFDPAGVYDGRKNLFIAHALNLSGGDTQTFPVPVASSAPRTTTASTPARPPAVYNIKITKAQEINPELLRRFVQGKQSQDQTVLTALMAMNVAIRQDPINRGYPFNTRSFFPLTGPNMLSAPTMGIQFARGYFQSIRPTIGKAILNVDITTGMFYQAGPLLRLCLSYISPPPRNSSVNPNDPMRLAPSRGFPDRERVRLQRFISNIRVKVTTGNQKIISVAKLTNLSAADLQFSTRDGARTTVARYFQQTYNRRLQYPDVICAQTTSGAAVPLELCEVIPGQIARKQMPPEVTSAMVSFSQLRPEERMRQIRQGVELLAHGQSDYVRNFGMIPSPTFPTNINARVINPPRLQYGPRAGGNSRNMQTVDPRNGSWNLRDITFIQPQTINRWVVVVFESPNRFPQRDAENMAREIRIQFQNVGMRVVEEFPVIHYANPQRDISTELKAAGAKCVQKNPEPKLGPDLLVVVLPDSSNTDIYRGVKHFGDVEMGVATQCLQLSKCRRAKPQYWANVALKVNPKLGGINHKPDPQHTGELNDPHRPTIIMGADVMHPAPGSTLPSYTAVVGNVDSDAAKYVAESRVQTGRVEAIDPKDLAEMVRNILDKYMTYRRNVEKKANSQPARLLFFRDGVDEGQYQKVKDEELDVIRKTCKALNINPKITFIIVAKRHHFRFFPKDPNDTRQADKSGNCLSGTVVDTGITHPLEFDFYLQSHGGLLGTSRSAHYHVLSDDNGFSADALQSLCFGLCHVFARSTRTISIPTPVAYADLVCSRAPNHYKSASAMSEIESTVTTTRGDASLARMKADFKPVHRNQAIRTFFT